MSWSEVFGAPWFWVAGALVWARAILGAHGVSRRLMKAARRDPAAARLAHETACWRLGPGRLWPASLDPLRWPFAGLVGAALLGEGIWGGNALSLALLTGLGPMLAIGMALEPRLLASAHRVGEASERDLTGFLDTLEEVWKARLASTLVCVGATVVAALALRP